MRVPDRDAVDVSEALEVDRAQTGARSPARAGGHVSFGVSPPVNETPGSAEKHGPAALAGQHCISAGLVSALDTPAWGHGFWVAGAGPATSDHLLGPAHAVKRTGIVWPVSQQGPSG